MSLSKGGTYTEGGEGVDEGSLGNALGNIYAERYYEQQREKNQPKSTPHGASTDDLCMTNGESTCSTPRGASTDDLCMTTGEPSCPKQSSAPPQPRQKSSPRKSTAPARQPAQQTYPDPNDVIHGTLNINPDSTHGVGNNGTIPKPTDVPQTYSSPLDANLGPTTDETAGRQFEASESDCANADLEHCIGDDPVNPPTDAGAGGEGGNQPPNSSGGVAGDPDDPDVTVTASDDSFMVEHAGPRPVIHREGQYCRCGCNPACAVTLGGAAGRRRGGSSNR
ncbi:hypothetical protein [Pseudofrankia inefficax]|uniref:Uncharacterized protein n=1 Tax=Pseudofrankia inefficax (strain DSM 45817 / CECT 9037 / DDB 130130 / EuI1c) TaxID=298654 RepID=E3J6I7_PSEI1|nr:hypothetical protein [Pseudofrankia inefficax]ADP80763.1 hypothetical protein FraEuI1c_2732 [Pseudofrankia inefficax]